MLRVRQTSIPNWDLSDLYTGIDDPAIERDQNNILRQARSLRRQWHGRVDKVTEADELAKLLKAYGHVLAGMRPIGAFASMVFSVRSTDNAYGAFMQKVQDWSALVMNEAAFVELEVGKIPAARLKSFIGDPAAASYRHWLDKVAAWKPHHLSEAEEQIIHEKSLTGRGAFTRLFEMEAARHAFQFGSESKRKTLTEAELLSKLHSHKRTERRKASKLLNEALQREARIPTFAYNMVVQDSILEARRRGFAAPEDARHLDNEVSRPAVEALVSAVRDSYGLVHEYYRFKQQLLGYDTLYDYDRYAPVGSEGQNYSFTEAREIVLQAFAGFSLKFAETAELFFDKGWIDAKPAKGKRGGAYCIYVTPDTHPYVFMNFTGTMNDVMTLAHELGHAVHAYLAREQSLLHFDWPITVAETASIFGEMIVFRHLEKELDQKDKLTLLMGRIDGMIASVYRQVAMFVFERSFFAAREQEGELLTEEISKLWKASFAEMYDKAVVPDKGSEIHWSYIPHFFNYPFYVYAYAFGELLTLSLFSMYEQGHPDFERKYMDMLAAGGSKSPAELLKPFGVDASKKAFWKKGIGEIEDLIQEAKDLA